MPTPPAASRWSDSEAPCLITHKGEAEIEECEWNRTAERPLRSPKKGEACQGIQLRGVKLGTLLHKASRVFRTDGEDDSYDLSSECEEDPGLDYFLSHAWTMSSLQKTLFLLVHFNRKAMIVVSTLSALFVAAFKLGAYMNGYDGLLLSFVPGPVNAGLVGYFIGMFFGHWLLPTRSKTIFLDKACIRQCRAQHGAEQHPEETTVVSSAGHGTLSSGSRVRFDSADCPACLEMKAGIEKIGDYLEHSSTLLVVLHSDYFSRLWCVYEFACFLRRHKPKDVHIISPQGVTLCLLGPILVIFLKVIKGSFVEGPRDYLVSIMTGLVWLLIDMIAVCELSDYTSRTLSQSIATPLRSFKISETQCAFESDRQYIYDNIEHDYGRMSLFENFIRERVSQSLFDAHLRVPCLTCVAMSIPMFWLALEKTVEWVTLGE
ncbi:hypothetical protein FOZ63_032989, partial [Perkinsus olseni]